MQSTSSHDILKLAPNSEAVRRLTLPRFPYSLLYRLLENDQIRILAVAHHKRRPQYWLDRE